MNFLRNSLDLKKIKMKRPSKQKKGAVEIVCTPSVTSLDQSSEEWKPWMNTDGDFNQSSDITSDDPGEIRFTDISSPHSSKNLSPSSSCTNFFEDDVDFDLRLDSSWSLLDEIVREFHSSDDHKELAHLFDKKKFLERPHSLDKLEVDKSNSEKRTVSLNSDWSMIDDIVSHFVGSDMYDDVAKILDTKIPENHNQSKMMIYQDSGCITGNQTQSCAESNISNECENPQPNFLKRIKGNFNRFMMGLFRQDKERELKNPGNGINISLT